MLEVAQKNAKPMGVADRYHLLPGSAFEVDFDSGYDLALITNFLHALDQATCTALMRKVKAALTPGRVAIAEFVPNSDRVSPPIAAAFSITMLAATLVEMLTLSRNSSASRKTRASRESSWPPQKSA